MTDETQKNVREDKTFLRVFLQETKKSIQQETKMPFPQKVYVNLPQTIDVSKLKDKSLSDIMAHRHPDHIIRNHDQ